MTRRTRSFALLILAAAAGFAFLLSQGDAAGSPRVDDSTGAAARSDPDPPAAESRRSVTRPAIVGRPFQQPVPPDDSEARAENELVLTVVNADDEPIENAIVQSNFERDFASLQILEDVTESDGTARITLWDEKTDLVVMANGYPPVLTRITDRARMRVTVPGAVALRGHVRVDGAAVTKPMWLSVRGCDDPTDAWPERFKSLLNCWGFGSGRIQVKTDASGAFVVRGLAPGSTVSIEVPEVYGFAHAAGSSNLRETTVRCGPEPVVIDLVTRKALTGTIVSGCDEPEFPSREYDDCEIRYRLEPADGTPAIAGKTSTRSGRFSIPFSAPSLRSATIEGCRYERRYFTKRVEDVTGSRDLGTIVIACPPVTRFRLIDPRGQPIRGGRVLVDGHPSNRSDDAGLTRLRVVPSATAVIAGAPGYRFTSIPIPDPRPDAMDVVLEPAITLQVRVRHEDPAIAPAGQLLTVDYRADDATKIGDSNWTCCDDFRMSPSWVGVAPDDCQRRVLEVRADTVLPFSGFKSGEDVRVQAWDHFGNTLASQDLHLTNEPIQPVELVVRARPRTIRGAVLDPDGMPIPGSKAAMGRALPKWAPDTDASGRFEFPDVYGNEVVVSARAPGYLAKTVAVSKQDEITVRLERGRSLTVEIAPSDRAFDGEVRFESENGLACTAERRAACVWFFDAVPCRAGKVVARTADSREASVAVGPTETRLRIQPPE